MCWVDGKTRHIEVHFEEKQPLHSNKRLGLFGVLFLVSLLSVFQLLSSHIALLLSR